MAAINLGLRPKFKNDERSCEGCTKCCVGWLTANIHGEEMYPGKPCHFVEIGKGCTIYKDRPRDPCKKFVCMWKAVDEVPLEFKPSEVDVILTRAEINGSPYLNAVEAGSTMNPLVLSWFVSYCVSKKINAHWAVDGKAFWMGIDPFNEAMMQRYFPV